MTGEPCEYHIRTKNDARLFVSVWTYAPIINKYTLFSVTVCSQHYKQRTLQAVLFLPVTTETQIIDMGSHHVARYIVSKDKWTQRRKVHEACIVQCMYYQKAPVGLN